MRKISYPNLIQESVSELEALKRTLKSRILIERCEILIWLKGGDILTMKKAVSLKGRSVSHGQKLWKLYKQEGLSGYLTLKYRPQQSPLTGKQELEEHLKTEGFQTINEARLWILEKYNISYTENGLGNYWV